MEGDEKTPLEKTIVPHEKTPHPNPYQSSFVDYDSMSEEEYFREMEKKVEYYKQNFPDMYEKAVKWMEMLNQSEIYKNNAPDDPSLINREKEKAVDLLKNVRYNGWTESDLNEEELALLGKYFPEWLEDRKEDE